LIFTIPTLPKGIARRQRGQQLRLDRLAPFLPGAQIPNLPRQGQNERRRRRAPI
jgi:hypothetical protein